MCSSDLFPSHDILVLCVLFLRMFVLVDLTFFWCLVVSFLVGVVSILGDLWCLGVRMRTVGICSFLDRTVVCVLFLLV